MQIEKHERILLLLLFKSRSKLSAFIAFKRSRISFPNFIKVIHNLESLKLITSNNQILELTEKGIQSVFQLQTNYINKKWRQIPKEYLEIKLDPNVFYVPNIDLLDIEFTKKTLSVK